MYPDLRAGHSTGDGRARMQREYLAAESAKRAARVDRSRFRRKQTILEFALLFTLTHWLFHGHTVPTLALSIALGTALAFAVERWFIGRDAATLLALVGYGILLGCGTLLGHSPLLLPIPSICSIILITFGTQVLRITRESEWQGA